MKRMGEITPPPAPQSTKWANVVVSNSTTSTTSSGSVSDDEEIVVPAKLDRAIEFLMTKLPAPWMSPTFVMLRNLYIMNPNVFRLSSEGHISGGDDKPHISIRVDIPYLHNKTGVPMKPWICWLHIYYVEREDDPSKRMYTEIVSFADSLPIVIAKYYKE